jgi:hypothetical protein
MKPIWDCSNTRARGRIEVITCVKGNLKLNTLEVNDVILLNTAFDYAFPGGKC